MVSLANLTGDIAIGSKFMITDDGGFAVRMINKTGGATVKGTIAHPNTGVSNSFVLSPVGSLDPIGIVYDAGIADSALCWVVTSGKAMVALKNAATGAGYIRVGVSADTGEADGYGMWEALPSSPFATDKHFQEIGHNLETVTTAAATCLCAIHFN